MDNLLTLELVKSLIAGDISKFIAYFLIFFFIWREVKGLRREMATLNKNVTTSFATGEIRFDLLEKNDVQVEHRLTLLENEAKHLKAGFEQLTNKGLEP